MSTIIPNRLYKLKKVWRILRHTRHTRHICIYYREKARKCNLEVHLRAYFFYFASGMLFTNDVAVSKSQPNASKAL